MIVLMIIYNFPTTGKGKREAKREQQKRNAANNANDCQQNCTPLPTHNGNPSVTERKK